MSCCDSIQQNSIQYAPMHSPLRLSQIVTATLAFHALSSQGAQLIPVDRTFGAAWQNSGYPGEIPAPTTIVNVRDFGAEGNGVADDHSLGPNQMQIGIVTQTSQ